MSNESPAAILFDELGNPVGVSNSPVTGTEYGLVTRNIPFGNQALKILGQAAPGATILTNLYTVPASTSTYVTSIIICNQNSATTVKFRVSVAPGGAVDNAKQYLYYDLPLDNNDTFIATIGITLATTDVIRVQSDTTNVSFNLLGIELS